MMEIKKDIIFIHHYFYRICIKSGFHLSDSTICLTFSLTCTKGRNPVKTRIQFNAYVLLTCNLTQRKMLVLVNVNKFKIDRQQHDSTSNFVSAM